MTLSNAELTERVTRLEEAVATKADIQIVLNAIAGLDGKVDGLTGEVKELDKKVDSLDGKTDDLAGDVRELDKKVDGLDGKVDGLGGEVNQLRGAVNTVETTMRDLMNPQT